ncbi:MULTISPECIES: sigma-54-dependent Fis family transcriptional regulator [Fusobacterium]|uniref:sigma-54 interaction domain-containing protein n=1 Tax=Fusobacterium TaxID=848 RepID=UPI001476D936|nr:MULTISPECIES: sigma 54-interacting transcriptional regulator [Fusobacterium]NME36385.1 sigma 54-interacting transcriptional regulator [Fusobacterium sp. FSA-380-WT-3A]
MKLLENIKEDINLYAEVISQVIGIDVEVMGKNFKRLIGTGLLKDKIDQNMYQDSYVYRNVLQSGELCIITNPREDEICRTCPSKEICKETLEISTPIFFNDDIIGVIGLICFTEQQKNNFLSKKDLYINFIKQISLSITSRLHQENEKIIAKSNNELLLNIIDRIPDSIIITNEDKKIEMINKSGLTLLKNIDSNLRIKINNETQMSDKKEFSLEYNNNTHEVIGDIIEINNNVDNFKTLYIFQESDKFRNYLQQINTNLSKNFIFSSPEMSLIYSKIYKVAKTTSTVFITGESGTGKEVVARLIHSNSDRNEKPFIAVNCGAIPESLIESEFFGYVKGAFTGANPNGKIGFFEQANGGTIFLDEIGDMPLSLQVKLLRVLQEKIICPIGSNNSKEIDIRVIAATNKDPEELVKENKFREDLYYRLNVFPIDIPPLRNRKKDIEELSKYFIRKYSKLFNRSNIKISDEVMEFFQSYNWPGNIRELKNVTEYIVNVIEEKDDEILLKHLPNKLFKTLNIVEDKTLAEIEKETIQNLLIKYGSSSKDKEKIAEILDIGIATLYRKIKLYNL